jgi:Tol biopolymer transport system component/predicted Ser/Thr protein kinase
MSLRPGDRLGPYEVLAAIGAGGMGEVFRGRDTRLDRDVAIKVLPDAVARDPERLARFEREAKTLAALNHPNVAQIYGLEGGALAMEFVEGEDLSARISRGPVPVDEAVAIAAQIADALEAAHELGIIHRDLKPSNIRVREDGAVKVLDFGLAKALASPSTLLDAQSSPTITSPALTELGVVLGTAAYMAPEQARGKRVDRRADIWAFGAVLYEMVTGRRPFEGETVTESLAAVLKSEPDLAPVPAALRRLLRSCLEKDPKKRLRDIGDWRRQLDDPAHATAAGATQRPWLAWSVAAAVAIAAAALAIVHFGETSATSQSVVFQIQAPPGNTLGLGLAISPDGRRIAFTARDKDNVLRLWIRDVDALEARAIPGTEGVVSIFWSPDGKFVGFTVGAAMKKVALEGGPVLPICTVASANGMGSATWSREGVIVFGGTTASVIRQVSESGGPVTALTTLDQERAELVHGIPAFLPDGRHFLYTRVTGDEATAGVFIGESNRKPEDQGLTRLVAASNAVYMRGEKSAGHLLYLRQGTLVSHAFDTERLALVGDASPVADKVGNFGSMGLFALGADVVAYRHGPRQAGAPSSQLTWVDRQGTPIGVAGSPAAYTNGLSLSPDDSRAAAAQIGPADVGLGDHDIWVVDLTRDVSQRLTSDGARETAPIWSPVGDLIAFQARSRGVPGNVFTVRSDGAGDGQPVSRSDLSKIPTSWSSDKRFILFQTAGGPTAADVWLLPLESNQPPVPLIQSKFQETGAQFSPNMQWIAYVSNVSGGPEVYVRPFKASAPSAPAAATQVSKGGGSTPRWRQNGELFYSRTDGSIMSVSIPAEGPSRAGAPTPLFRTTGQWDVASDGKRFLVTVPVNEVALSPITVVLHWKARGR